MILPSFASTIRLTQPKLGVYSPGRGCWLIALDRSESVHRWGREPRFFQVGSGTWETEDRATRFPTRDDAAFYAAEIGRDGQLDLAVVFRSV